MKSGGGACAALAPGQRQQINPHRCLITIRFGERLGTATAEAFAVLLGLRLLRRCRANPRNFGIVIIDRVAIFPNLVALVEGTARAWQEPFYEHVLGTILNDIQRAADDRGHSMIVHLMSRANAAPLLRGNRVHMMHNWMPRVLLQQAEAWNRARENRDDGHLIEAAVDPTLARNWRIQIIPFTLDHELELLVIPNPKFLPPPPNRPAP